MRQQDKILSRQKTRLNPITGLIAPVWGVGREQNYRVFVIALQTGPYRTMQTRLWHCVNRCFEFLPFRSFYFLLVVSSGAAVEPQALSFRTNTREQRLKKERKKSRQWNTVE